MKAIVKLAFLIFVPSVSYYSIWSKQNLEIFNVAGSSSAQNIFNALLQGEKDYSVAISNTGSAIGLERLESGSADLALVSYDISDWMKENSRKTKYKSLKIAEENIAIAYKPPSSCTQDIEIDSSKVKDLFALLFGHKHSDSIKINLTDFISSSNNVSCSQELISLVKSSGPTKSGTVKSLFSLSILPNENGDTNWLNKIKQGYGKDSKLVFAHESGLMHAEYFLQNVVDGWITYLPGSFAIKNKSLLNSKGVKFAKIKFSNSAVDFPTSNDNTGNSSYTWKRPFNLVYSIQNPINEKFKSFLEKMIDKIDKLSLMNLQKANNIDKSKLFSQDTA